jgi:hypothetical protein
MSILETFLNLLAPSLKPFTKKWYVSFLYKYNNKYKALGTRIEKVLDDNKEKFTHLFQEDYQQIKEKNPQIEVLI